MNNQRTYSLWAWTKAYAALLLTLPAFVLCWFLATLVRRLPFGVTRWLLQRHTHYTETHPVDVRIPPDPSVRAYMERWWWIPRNAFMNCYWHVVRRSDDDRALHDHPWWNFSIVVDGGYFEHRILEGGIHAKTWRPPGTMAFRWHGKKAHRLELKCEHRQVSGYIFSNSNPALFRVEEIPARTIFITGPVLRRWGFHHSTGWVDAYDWDDFCQRNGIKAMQIGGGSDAVLSERNHHKIN